MDAVCVCALVVSRLALLVRLRKLAHGGGAELGHRTARAQTLHSLWTSDSLGAWGERPGVPSVVVMSASVVSVISRFLEEYLSSTPQRLKLLDAYLLYILLTGALQFGYCLLVGTFPFNSFLSGFISCVGSFILAGNDSIRNHNNNVLL